VEKASGSFPWSHGSRTSVPQMLKHPNNRPSVRLIETTSTSAASRLHSAGKAVRSLLAHRYLKERMPASYSLSSISGASGIYIQRKIVHRDLKLEKLLLDR